MYLIIKHIKYETLNDDYIVAGTSDYLEGANEMLEAHRIINKNKNNRIKLKTRKREALSKWEGST